MCVRARSWESQEIQLFKLIPDATTLCSAISFRRRAVQYIAHSLPVICSLTHIHNLNFSINRGGARAGALESKRGIDDSESGGGKKRGRKPKDEVVRSAARSPRGGKVREGGGGVKKKKTGRSNFSKVSMESDEEEDFADEDDDNY